MRPSSPAVLWSGYIAIATLSVEANNLVEELEIPSWTTVDFYDAIDRDDVKSVQDFLSDTERATKEFLSYYLLDYALEHGRDQIAQLMVEAGAGVDTLSAVQYEHVQILEELLNRDVEPRGASLAAELGSMQMLELLLEHGAKDLSTEGAAKSGQSDAIKLLLEHGADPEGLGLAILHGHEDVAQILLESGADPDEVTRHHLGRYDLDFEIPRGYYFEYLSPLHYAVLLQSREIVELLLDNGANPNVVPNAITLRENRSDRSPWPTVLQTMTKIQNADRDIALLLEEYGATLNVSDDNEDHRLEEFLYEAANTRDHKKIVELLEEGAQPTGFGEFYYAFSGSYDPKIIKAFFDAGANPDIYDGHYPYTPTAMTLMNRDLANFRRFLEAGTTIDDLLIGWYMKVACVEGMNEAIELLWTFGNTRDVWEIVSPVSYGHIHTVEFLLAKGIKPVYLRHAVEQEHVEIVKMLLEAGADPDEQDNHDERSILEIALELGNEDIAQLLKAARATE
ncbi:MAG: hypothetical protein F4W92_09435 [Gammaproteobacteria bacterium]|nr:hypothetical protein [Gammaproteobacteria bacterium]